MDVISGIGGLALAFIILAAVLSYFVINSKGNVVTKIVLIAIVGWYGLILSYTPTKLMGWPTNSPMPNNTIIITAFANEPGPGSEGSIYLLCVTRKLTIKKNFWDQFSYKSIFGYNKCNSPRLYRLPYTREAHKLIFDLLNEAERRRGYIEFRGGSNDGSLRDDLAGDQLTANLFEIINPGGEIPEKNVEQEESD